MQQAARYARAGAAFAGLVALALAASLMVPSRAFANPTAAEKQAEAQATLVSLNSMQDKLDQAAVVYDDALAAQKDAENKSVQAQQRVDEASQKIADLQERLGKRARSMYRTGSDSFLDLLLGSTSFAAFSTNWDMLNHISENDASLVQQTKDLRTEIQEQKAALAEQQRIATQKADEARRSKEDTASTMAAMQATYDSLSTEAADLLKQEREAQAALQTAQAKSVVEAAAKQSGNGAFPTPAPGPTPGPAPSAPSAPGYNQPVASTVVGRAYSQLGKPYGYEDPSYGAGPTMYDCSGFVAFCLTGSYTRMGSTTTMMQWPRVAAPQPGDVAVSPTHAGIYIGGGQMIHSSTYGVGVIQGPVMSNMIFVRP